MSPARRPEDDLPGTEVRPESRLRSWHEPNPTKRRIEDAAAKLFASKGVDGATTREIARAAECSEGVIYRYWPSKEALARDLFNFVHSRLAQYFRYSTAKGLRIDDQASIVVGIYCGMADMQWDRFAFHLLATHRFLPTPDGEDNPVAAAEDMVRAAMARGEIAKGDPVVVAAMALGVVLQTALHKVYGRLEGPLSPHADVITRAVVAVLRSEDPNYA